MQNQKQDEPKKNKSMENVLAWHRFRLAFALRRSHLVTFPLLSPYGTLPYPNASAAAIQVMDAALLLVAGNETCPQPQTSEHLAAVEIMRLQNIIILQNKVTTSVRGRRVVQHRSKSAPTNETFPRSFFPSRRRSSGSGRNPMPRAFVVGGSKSEK